MSQSHEDSPVSHGPEGLDVILTDAVDTYGYFRVDGTANDGRREPDELALLGIESTAGSFQGVGQPGPDGSFETYQYIESGTPVDRTIALGVLRVISDAKRRQAYGAAETVSELDFAEAPARGVEPAGTDGQPEQPARAEQRRRTRGRTGEPKPDFRNDRRGRDRRDSAVRRAADKRAAWKAANQDGIATSPADTEPTDVLPIPPAVEQGNPEGVVVPGDSQEQSAPTERRRRLGAAIGSRIMRNRAVAAVNTGLMIALSDRRVRLMLTVLPFAAQMTSADSNMSAAAEGVYDFAGSPGDMLPADLQQDLPAEPFLLDAAPVPEAPVPPAETPAPPLVTPDTRFKLDDEGKGVWHAVAEVVTDGTGQSTAVQQDIIEDVTAYAMQHNFAGRSETSLRLGEEFVIPGEVMEQAREAAEAREAGVAAEGIMAPDAPEDAAGVIELDRENRDLNSLDEAIKEHYEQGGVAIPEGLLPELRQDVAEYSGITPTDEAYGKLADGQKIYRRDQAGLLAWIADAQARLRDDD